MSHDGLRQSSIMAQSAAASKSGSGVVYPKKQWKKDSVAIVVLREDIGWGGYADLADIIDDFEVREARSIVLTMDDTKQQEFRQLAVTWLTCEQR